MIIKDGMFCVVLDMYNYQHFSWIGTNIAMDILSQGHWSFNLLSICWRHCCFPKRLSCFGDYSCELFQSSWLVIMYLMFLLSRNDIFYFKGVNVIYRTRELEEEQAKRYSCVLCFFIMLLIYIMGFFFFDFWLCYKSCHYVMKFIGYWLV